MIRPINNPDSRRYSPLDKHPFWGNAATDTEVYALCFQAIEKMGLYVVFVPYRRHRYRIGYNIEPEDEPRMTSTDDNNLFDVRFQELGQGVSIAEALLDAASNEKRIKEKLTELSKEMSLWQSQP